jgi:hypothetical protein
MMPEPTEWYTLFQTGVESLKSQLGRDAQDYHLDRFLKLARRVDEFAADCPKCKLLRPQMDQMLRDLAANAPQILREQKRSFLGQMQDIMSHLHKTHGLIGEGQNVGTWLAIGTAVGVALGAGLSNPLIGIPTGVVLGLIVGTVLDNKAKKEGKVI